MYPTLLYYSDARTFPLTLHYRSAVVLRHYCTTVLLYHSTFFIAVTMFSIDDAWRFLDLLIQTTSWSRSSSSKGSSSFQPVAFLHRSMCLPAVLYDDHVFLARELFEALTSSILKSLERFGKREKEDSENKPTPHQPAYFFSPRLLSGLSRFFGPGHHYSSFAGPCIINPWPLAALTGRCRCVLR